jgi:DNA-binding ferritin-like protein
MEFVDKETLKMLTKKYSDNDIAGAVVSIVVNDESEQMTLEEYVLKFIRTLEGARVRAKELHWNTKSSTIHDLMDHLIAMITSFEDDIAECFMGICKFRIKVGQVVPDIPDVSDHIELIDYLSVQTLSLMKMLIHDIKYIGLNRKLEDMYCELNKLSYLATQE